MGTLLFTNLDVLLKDCKSRGNFWGGCPAAGHDCMLGRPPFQFDGFRTKRGNYELKRSKPKKLLLTGLRANYPSNGAAHPNYPESKISFRRAEPLTRLKNAPGHIERAKLFLHALL